MNLPWMKLHTRDWLDNKELRRCSPIARGILSDLMCLAHEGIPYGHLADKVGPLTIKYMASRCVVANNQFLRALAELQTHGRIAEVDGVLIIPRMVADEAIRQKRAAGGSESIGHPNTHPPKGKEGYPSDHPSSQNGGLNHSRARIRADSDSGSNSETGSEKKKNNHKDPVERVSLRFEEFWAKYPKKFDKNSAARDWANYATIYNEKSVFDCLERYLRSNEVASGAVRNPGSTVRDLGWIAICAGDEWKSDWPQVKAESKKTTGLEEFTRSLSRPQ